MGKFNPQTLIPIHLMSPVQKKGSLKVADKTLKEYLKDWFKIYHLHMMPEPIRKQLEKAQGDDDFDVISPETLKYYQEYTGNDSLKVGERIYYNSLLSGPQILYFNKKTGKIDDRPLPKITLMNEAEQMRLYRTIRTTLRNINDNKPEYIDPASPPRVAAFLGKGKAFQEFKLHGSSGDMADEKLKTFAAFVTGDSYKGVSYPGDDILYQKLENALASRLGEDYSVSQFLADLKGEPIRQKALNAVPELIDRLSSWIFGYGSELSPELKDKLQAMFGNSEQIEKIARAVNQEGEPIDPLQFQQFLDPRVHDTLLKALYDPSKPDRKSGFAKDFEKHGGGTAIIKPMQIAIDRFKYDHLSGTYKKRDVRTFSQKLKKDWEDWSEAHVVKLWQRNLRHNYLEPKAKPVVDALCKAEVSPTKGLKGILDKRADIKKKLEAGASPGSVNGFDFLCDTIEKINNAGDMKNAFNGALKNGKQCEAIAKEVIKAALANVPVTNTTLENAKIALETIAVMRYDVFSSARGKEIQKSMMGANFLDGASFMKNDGVKFIFNAAQKMFNFGMTGAFWATTMVRNTVQHSRGKIDESQIKSLVGSMDKIQENSDENMTVESAKADLETAEKELAEFEKIRLFRKRKKSC